MGVASYNKKVRVSTDGKTWKDVPTTSPSLDFGSDVIDDTDLANTTGFRSRVIGLHDWSVKCDSNYSADSEALAMIRNAKLSRSILYVQYLPTGEVAGGYQGKVVVESFNLAGEIGGLETVAITLQADGALGVAV